MMALVVLVVLMVLVIPEVLVILMVLVVLVVLVVLFSGSLQFYSSSYGSDYLAIMFQKTFKKLFAAACIRSKISLYSDVYRFHLYIVLLICFYFWLYVQTLYRACDFLYNYMHVEKTEINDRAECYHRYMSQGTFRMYMESETPEKVGLRRLVARRREHNKKILLLFCRDIG